jgi:hypothetical protein
MLAVAEGARERFENQPEIGDHEGANAGMSSTTR